MTPVLYRTEGILHINWIMICRKVKLLGLIGAAAATGSWVTSIRLDEQSLPYLQQATNKFERVQVVAGPNPEATVKCLNRKADAAEKVAIAAKYDEAVGAPSADLNKIPDCPQPKK